MPVATAVALVPAFGGVGLVPASGGMIMAVFDSFVDVVVGHAQSLPSRA
jgi:hypothetical protein